MSQFWQLVDDEFGSSYGRMLTSSHVLEALANRTPDDALEAGMKPREVWFALCEDLQIPPERRLGRDVPVRDTGKD